MKKEELLKSIDEMLSSDEIICNNVLQAIFLKAKDSVQSDEYGAVSGLSNDLSMYLMTNRFLAPKKVIEFAGMIAKEPHKERGKGAFLKMLAMSLVGMK